jgi:hypothetical protein
MPREEHRTVFRWNDGKEAGHGNGISRDDEFMADCVVVCFFLSRSFYLVFYVYLSFCFLWFLWLGSGWMSSGWMISRWMNSVGNLCIYEASTASVKETSTSTSSRVSYHCENITFHQYGQNVICYGWLALCVETTSEMVIIYAAHCLHKGIYNFSMG